MAVVQRASTVVLMALTVAIAGLVVLPGQLGGDTLVVRSGSMEPAIRTGSVVVIMPVEPNAVGVGDVITYLDVGHSQNVTHRVVETQAVDGALAFVTRGDANEAVDRAVVPAERLRGRVVLTVPGFGWLSSAVRTPMGWLAMVVAPALLVIGREVGLIRGALGEGAGVNPEEELSSDEIVDSTDLRSPR